MENEKVKQRPILFSSPMVRAILDGRKTQTRRTKGLELLNERPNDFTWHGRVGELFTFHDKTSVNTDNNIFQKIKCPFGLPGNILWVRETWVKNTGHLPTDLGYVYKAELGEDELEYSKELSVKWKPSIFMPKKACRIFLKITDVRIERLQEISEDDAKAEGVERWIETRLKSKPTRYKVYCDKVNPTDPAMYSSTASGSFETLWHLINGRKSWDSNPYVWVISFKKC